MSTAATRAGSALAAATGAVLAGSAVVVTGRTLPLPTDLHPARLATWAGDVGPTTATFTALRALGAALLAWMVLTASAGIVARRLRSAPATRLLDRVSLPVVRRFANGVAGAALVAATLADPATAGARAAPAAPATPASTAGAVVTMHEIVATPVIMRALDQEDPPAAGRSGSTWVVAAGDTLWHVAERLVIERTGGRADPAAILDELDRLVAVNADRLVVPGNPDLVFPGQELRLP